MKRIIALLMAALLIFALAACGTPGADDSGNKAPENSAGSGGDTGGSGGSSPDNSASTGAAHTIKVWASQDDQALTKDLADKFIAANPDYSVKIEFGVVGEPDAYKTYSEDPAAAADVFFFPNDQLRDFVKAGGLAEVTRKKDDIVARNMDSSIAAATLDGALWGYPATADNGYFLYYDKSVLSEEDVKTLDRILEVSAAAGKRFLMGLDDNGWYLASFFLGAGCTLTIGPDGKQVCNFNNADGLAAAQAIAALTANPVYINGDDGVLKGGIGGSIAAGVSGTWNAEDISGILGDNYGATKLPTFTMNGKQVQMGSFGGYKLAGVNSMITDPEKMVIAMDFANFLTNEESQVARFNARAIGPSNINAAANPAVQANIALAALAAQSVYATSQNDVLGEYWTPAGALGTAIVNQSATDLQALLDNMVAQIQS